MAEATLVQMYRGGIFDHIGGGFSRYSTDERWLVPHFEKMLYDNALLVMAYSEAYGPVSYTHLDVYKRQEWKLPESVPDTYGKCQKKYGTEPDREGTGHGSIPEDIWP